MHRPIHQLPAIIVITFMFVLMFYWVVNNNEEKISQREKAIINKSLSNYKAIIDGYKGSAMLFYRHCLMTPKISSLMKKAAFSYGREKHEIRKNLYDHLVHDYKKIKASGFDQLHFHAVNCESFLNFSHPDSYGANLKPLRFTVKKTNDSHKPTFGGEKGQFSVGYRFVFPLFYDNDFAGSVELSAPFAVINEKIEKVNNGLSVFLINNGQEKSSKIAETNLRQKDSAYIKNFVTDRLQYQGENKEATLNFYTAIIQKFPGKISETLKHKYTNIINFAYKNTHYSLVNMPVPNAQGKYLGNYLIAYPNQYISKLKNELYIRISIITLSYLLLIFAFVLIVRREKQIIDSEKKLRISQTRLIETNETKSKLFEIITHDLRNHFNAVNGFVNLVMKRGYNSSKSHQRLFLGLSDAVHLTNALMNNLFMWSRIQTGGIDCNLELFETSKWLSSQLKKFESICNRKQIEIINQTKAPVYIYADIDLLTIIVLNVIHNAIKFSTKNRNIVVHISDNTQATELTVKDKGRGMTPTEVGNLLNRESWSGARSSQDIGLGVFVARKLVEYHNGNFEVDSAPGIGTTVKITIPKT